jgi:hypothetical protein
LALASSLNNEQQLTSTKFDSIQLAQHDRDQFHYRRVPFSSQLKSKVGNILAKAAALRINLNIDGSPIASTSHVHSPITLANFSPEEEP